MGVHDLALVQMRNTYNFNSHILKKWSQSGTLLPIPIITYQLSYTHLRDYLEHHTNTDPLSPSELP